MISFVSLLRLAILVLTLNSASAVPIERRAFITRNDIINGICTKVTVIFARGTTEVGNVGALVGPPFFSALTSRLSGAQVAVQGVNYPADIIGYLAGGSSDGAATMASLVRTARTNCPSTEIVLSGYSQGAQVTHKAAALLTVTEALSVKSIVLFGDPDDGKAFPGTLNNHVKTFCHTGDLICLGEPIVLPMHLTYGLDAGEAANFVVANL